MKKTLHILVLLFVTGSAVAQNVWIGPNAVWHYDFSDGPTEGFIKVEYTDDTLIDAQNCQHLKGTKYEFFQTGPGSPLTMNVAHAGDWYTYVSGDTVFYRQGSAFRVLYNFGAQQGEQWLISDEASPFQCNDSSYLEVLWSGPATIGGELMTQLSVVETAGSGFGIQGNVASRFGWMGQNSPDFLFPMTRNCDPNTVVEFYLFSFKCYSDDNFSYNPFGEDCEYLLTHLGLAEETALTLSLSPNPVSDKLSVTAPETLEYFSIFSPAGERLLFMEPASAAEITIDVSNLAPGVYYLQAGGESGMSSVKKFVRH